MQLARLIGPLAVGVVLAGLSSAQDAVLPRGFSPLDLPGADLRLVPESERPFRRVVIGLDPNTTRYFMVPSVESLDPKVRDPRVVFLRRQLYWMNFELVHGNFTKVAPAHTRFFVALPDPALNPESLGNEEEVFREYLAVRAGWTKEQIADRTRFFKVPIAIRYPQDMAQPLGYDGRKRLVLGLGMDVDHAYREGVKRLGDLFPNEFAVRDLPEVNTEGGDLDLTWLPERKLGVLVGHNRILRYLHRKYGSVHEGRSVPRARIEEARKAFSRAFFDLEVVILNEEALRNPRFMTNELFHLDMVVNVLRSGTNILAFVPSYAEQPVDALTHVPLAEELRSRVQREYDWVANQLSTRGYRVIRLPFADHPVRNPVNVAKYVDPVTGRAVVLLGKYPYHFATTPGGKIPQFELEDAFTRLEAVVDAWRAKPTDARWNEVTATLQRTWKEMDRISATPNPTFSDQARVYEMNGVKVVPVAIYPTGEGGLHCLGLASNEGSRDSESTGSPAVATIGFRTARGGKR